MNGSPQAIVSECRQKEMCFIQNENTWKHWADNMKIEESRSVKYRGVLIDKERKFTDHINQVSKKLRHFFSKEVTLLYYNLYIKHAIQYGIFVYGVMYETHLYKLPKCRENCCVWHFSNEE